jgi:hypothetical protein
VAVNASFLVRKSNSRQSEILPHGADCNKQSRNYARSSKTNGALARLGVTTNWSNASLISRVGQQTKTAINSSKTSKAASGVQTVDTPSRAKQTVLNAVRTTAPNKALNLTRQFALILAIVPAVFLVTIIHNRHYVFYKPANR